MDKILAEDMENIRQSEFIPWGKLEGKTILVTGATGLIGYNLVRAILYCTDKSKVIAVTRGMDSAKERFEDIAACRLSFIESTVENFDTIKENIYFIIHCAANTSSRDFIEKPVECIETTIKGTRNLLEIASQNSVESFVFLSSMEVYGYPKEGHKVKEGDPFLINSAGVRNSYPIAKIAAESLCVSYFNEYNVPAKIIRLTQTFGPGVRYDDKRVFAEFARCVIENKDIVLKTEGKTKRSYLYTADAVTAILTVLLKGNNGKAYNAANESTYCSIKEFAQKAITGTQIRIVQDIQNPKENGYANELYMDLDVQRLSRLGWTVNDNTSDLEQMIKRMICCMSS